VVDLRGSHSLPKLRMIQINIDDYDAAAKLAAKAPLRLRVMELRADGMSYQSIADTLKKNFRTVRKLAQG
jgi:DNA-binding NarL/FixJ family response regulator